MVEHYRLYLAKFVRAKTKVSGELYWIEPELRGKIVAIHVNMRRLIRFVAVKIEAVRTETQRRRHLANSNMCISSPCFIGLPADPFGSGYEIEVAVAAEQRERVLAAEGGDPEVVGRNWFAFAP